MTHSLRTPSTLIALALLLTIPAVSIADSWYVSASADPGGDGLDWGTAFQTIQAGIDASTNGDEVWIADGIYIGDGNRDISFDGKAITVQSLNGPESCIIDCQGTEEEPHRGFSFVCGETLDSVLKGVTIQNGYGPEEDPDENGTLISSGGAIYIYNSSPRIEQCVLENSYAHNGGGVYGYGCGSEFLNCITRKNQAHYGGGICAYSSDSSFVNCIVRKNQALYGGGVYLRMSNIRFLNCTMIYNLGDYFGLYYAAHSSCLFSFCKIYANACGDDWAFANICHDYGTLELDSCLLVGNDIGRESNALIIADCYGVLNCRNTTIWNDQWGYVYGDSGYDGSISNTIMTGHAFVGDQLHYYVWPSGEVQHSMIQGSREAYIPGSTNFTQAPIFVRNPSDGGDGWGDDPLTPDVDESLNDDFGDLRLQYGSPGIDAGLNDLTPTDQWDLDGDGDVLEPVPFDFANKPRFHDATGAEGQTSATVDIGAYEFPADCNENGIPDEQDIQSGYSRDCNTNGIPDECEPDCNTNGQADECDLLAGVSFDDNKDGIPDECQQIIFVSPDAPDGGDGQSWETAFNTIQAAVDAVQDAGEILLADGVYTGDGNRDILLDTEVYYVHSVHGPENCILDCQGTEEDPHRGFLFKNDYYRQQLSVLEGVSIIRGRSSEIEFSGDTWDVGGALVCQESAPVIKDCVFRNNSAYRGGAIGILGAGPVLVNCDVSCNQASGAGGGLYGSTNLRLYSCRIMNNESHYGGGIYQEHGHCRYESCLISGNKAESGGGVYLYLEDNDNIDFVNCEFQNNQGYGGAMYYAWGRSECYVNLTNCSLVNNYSFSSSSAIFYRNADSTELNILNSIIRNPDRPGDVIKFQYPYYDGEINVSHSNIQGGWEGDFNIDVDPQWAFPEAPVLMPGSQCIDTGSNGPGIELPELDFEDNLRILNDQVDMGAYEFDPARSVKLVSQQQTVRLIAYGGTNTISETLQFRNAGTSQVNWMASIVSLDGAGEPAWLQLSSSQGTCLGEVQSIDFTVCPDNLVPGIYNAQVRIEGDTDPEESLVINIEFIVGDTIVIHPDGTGEFPTIQEGIDAASPGDVILCTDGVYSGPGNRNISFRGKPVYLRSQNGPELTIIECEESALDRDRGFTFENGEGRTSILEGFTIRNAVAKDERNIGNYGRGIAGGGVLCKFSSPRITQCIFVNNDASNPRFIGVGGGVYAFEADVLLEDCTFLENQASHGGGGIYAYRSEIDCRRCVFSRNLDNRGIITTFSSSLNVTDCLFSENQGPALFSSGIAKIDRSRFINNSGGGLILYGNATVNNSELWGNSCTYGGAIRTEGTALYCENTSIVANYASRKGGGVYSDRSLATEMHNCLIWANSAEEEGNQLFENDPLNPLALNYSCIQDGWDGEGESNIDADPLLADIARGNLRLRAGSPCIDAGNNDRSTSETDLAGLPRFYDDPSTPDTGLGTPPVIDMGAFEYQPHEGDYDADGDVDLADFAWFQTCLGSTGHNCQAAFGFDDDTEITLADYAQLADHLTGPR